MTATIEQAHKLLDKLAAERFFGTLSFQFQNGVVSLIRKEETIRPANGTTGTAHDYPK